jgi:16S rRNA (cytosine1402-N4)-methyltransferase
LAQIISNAVRQPLGYAARSFQAIRIYVNDELSELRKGLFMAEKYLKPGGVCCVVSFHSLEDRLTKRFFKACSLGRSTSLDESGFKDDCANFEAAGPPSFDVLAKVITPSRQEIKSNSRSISAKLRWARRTCHAPLN